MGKNVVIIGSTGSIGRSTLDIIKNNPGLYRVSGLACNSNVGLLVKQIEEFNPEFVSLYSEEEKEKLEYTLKRKKIRVKTYYGEAGNIEAATRKNSDIVVISVVGGIGLPPTLAAIDAQKKICLANKETIVCGGKIVMREARKKNVKIVPVDSEHSAIFQLLEDVPRSTLRRIILTASGGPFRSFSAESLEKITVEKALKHPNWKMGPKITIDSATLMNKGLEVIEAMWLFDLPIEKIDVIIHPQSIIHSMIELNDGSIFAQMGHPDMRIPINYALSYPERSEINHIERFDFLSVRELTFEKPDLKVFPALKYAYDAVKSGGTMPTAMNAANEMAVGMFLNNKIKFTEISRIVKAVMKKHEKAVIKNPEISDIVKIDRWARDAAEAVSRPRQKRAM